MTCFARWPVASGAMALRQKQNSCGFETRISAGNPEQQSEITCKPLHPEAAFLFGEGQ